MADDHSGSKEKETEAPKAEDEKVPVPLGNQLAPKNEPLQAPPQTQQQLMTQRSLSVDSVAAIEAPTKSLFGSSDSVGNVAAAKRARGRPRKDFPRPPKHHLNQSVAGKVMRGRGRPRRDDILHHKIFPGRPRFRGKKFPYFSMSSKLQGINRSVDSYEENKDVFRGISQTSDHDCSIMSPTKRIPDNEVRFEHFCAFCNLSESSVLGQGKLTNFKPTSDFNCFESMEQKSNDMEKTVEVSSEAGSELKLFFRKQKSLESGEHLKLHRSKSLQSLSEKSSIVSDLYQELDHTGYKAPPASKDIFESSGEMYAHFNCAAYSDGVTKTFEKKLFSVDKAFVAAAFQRCSKCDRYGASVKCCYSECTKIYHYPCAIVSGALQNANCFKIICYIHREHAFSFGVLCAACHESGDLSQLILCTSCASYYHGKCVDPPIAPSADVRAGWQCSECKVCQNCRQPENDSKMLICNTCDKGYHVYCVKPAVTSVPKSGWKCSACRMCGDCGARTPGNGPSSRWHLNYTVCDSCYQQRNKGVACPLCGKAYRQCSQRKSMKHCIVCQKYIHADCDKRIGISNYQYVCPICTNSEGRHLDESFVEHHIKDSFQGSSRDSFLDDADEETLSDESDSYYEPSTSKISSRRTSSEQRQKKRSKPRLKALEAPPDLIIHPSAFLPKEYKMDDDDPTEDNKMVLTSATDEFVLCQDLCVMCGSFGKGEEGRLVACAQCGQCYHSYCASIKVTTVVLKKGWRCLDCTVCEGCGQPHDEGRLLLCDECDISFHIYCLDPPLQEVPQGNWKCKWCVMCIKCGSKSPGLNCNWQVNYTLCGPCASFTVCCLCIQHYEENELIIQCGRCERWLHGMCDEIETEDQAEKCADYGYTCPHCRAPDELPPHLLPPPDSPIPEEPIPEKHASPIAKIKEPEPPVVKVKPPVQYYIDGVYLSECGMQHIKALAPEQPKKIPRPRKLKHLDGKSLLQLDREDSTSAAGGSEETKVETPSSAELGLKAYDFEDGKMVMDGTKDLLGDPTGDKKKRPRKLQKLGIGGFCVKLQRSRSLSTKESSGDQAENAAIPPPESPFPLTSDTPILASDEPKKKPKRKPKKKTHLDEIFPGYLRDAFFGKELLQSCKKLGRVIDLDDPNDGTVGGTSGQNKSAEEHAKGRQHPLQGHTGPVTDLKHHEGKDFGGGLPNKNLSNPNIIYKNLIKSEIESIKEEHLSSTSNISDLSGLPQIDSKEVEDVFQGVLRDQRMNNPVQFRLKYNVDPSLAVFQSKNSGSIVPQGSASYVLKQGGAQGVNQSALHPGLIQNLQHADSNSSWPDSDCDQSQMQKNILKWESDEKLGLLSTISPVLYANINLPHLKIEFPQWTDRVKQIAKIWRGLPTEKRQPYLQRAKENRTACRSQRSSSTDSERSQRETKAQEVDQEKQWKQFHALRLQQQAAQQRMLQEQRMQAAFKGQAEKVESGPSVSDLEKNLKLLHSKSMSEIPQLANVPSTDDNQATVTPQKVLEKRWSSSAIDLNTAENILQGNSLNDNQASLQKSLMQERITNSLLNVAKIRSPLNSPLHIPDAAVPPSPAIKQDPYQSVLSPHAIQKQPFSPQQNRNAMLINRTEIARAPTPTIQKETLHTPPPTPRPHSSESFFQMSASPQSQLLASLDTHSQPTPARSKLMGPANVFEGGDHQVTLIQGGKIQIPVSTSSGQQAGVIAGNVPMQSNVQMTSNVQTQPNLQIPTVANIQTQVNRQRVPSGNIHMQAGLQRASVDNLQTQANLQMAPANIQTQANIQMASASNIPTQGSLQLANSNIQPHPNLQMQSAANMQTQASLQMQSAANIQTQASLQMQSAANIQAQANLQMASASPLKAQNQQPVMNPVEQFVLQQASNFPASHIVKQLSQYNSPMVNSQEREALLAQEKAIQQQNIEQFLRNSQLSMPFQNKIVSHQHLRDLLQSKKRDNDVIPSNEAKLMVSELPPQEDINTPERLKISDVLGNPPPQVESRVQPFQSPQHEKMDILSRPDSRLSNSGMSSTEKVSQHNVQEERQTISSSQKELELTGKKRKTTAGDLVKDLETEQDLVKDIETQQEGQDPLVGNLELLPEDVGDLELDDDELLGLGNDFNILEYADPELDKSLVGEGEKSNILDEHLDLDDKDEELEEEDVIKEEGVQEKDLLSEEIEDKKDLGLVNPKNSSNIDQSKSSHLHQSYLDFDKKDLQSNVDLESSFKPKNVETTTVGQLIVKEEPKQAFSSCTLSSQTYSPSIDIKLEKGVSDNCNLQKTHNIAFAQDASNMGQRPVVPEQLIPPPAYRMVTAIKQSLASPQSGGMPVQSKGMFPLHINMNLRQDLPPNVLASGSQQSKPLLLQEQPLLLEDLVEQEKREQRRQTQEGLISPHGDALLSDIDFERLKDDVFSGPPDDSLGGPGSLLGGHEPSLQVAPSGSASHGFGPPPYSLLWQNQESGMAMGNRPMTIMQNLKEKAPVQAVLGSLGPIPGSSVQQKPPTIPTGVPAVRPFNPNFVPGHENVTVDALVDPEKLKLINYEKYLMQQHALLSNRQKYFETEIIKYRKVKKALNAKQRQLRKNGSELPENDANELQRVSQEQAVIQKQLDQVRKQNRQNSIAVHDYRLKQTKRQPQQQQSPQQSPQHQVPRSPIHPSVSSLQSSPQNSQSPIQFSHTAPQSPLTPNSPVATQMRIQHSPSPLMHSPVSMATSVPHQTTSVYSQQQQVQFQVKQQLDNKSWSPPVKIQQGDNIQPTERFAKQEQLEGNLNSSTFPLSSSSNPAILDSSLKGLVDVKKILQEDNNSKKFPDKSEGPSGLLETKDDSNFTSKSISLDTLGQSQIQQKEQKVEIESSKEPTGSQSILTQSLPSSVSNTLKFTLRQTGMPAGCLPASDSTSDNPAELAFSSPIPEMQPKVSEPAPILMSTDKKSEPKDNLSAEFKPSSVGEDGSKAVKLEQVSGSDGKVINKTSSESVQTETMSKSPVGKSQETDTSKEQAASDKNAEQNLLRAEIIANIKQEIIEDAPVASNNTTGGGDIKTELGTRTASTEGSKNKKDDGNEGSSDEELENISKTLADKEREQAEQNVLLKQLLQNCPSAETPRKPDSLIELRKDDDDLNKLDVQFDISSLQNKNMLIDPLTKKPSYLDIRRAQLDKEPTPPPGEKAKPIKRKRPKKKVPEGPPGIKPEGGMNIPKKKCRRSSSKLEEGLEPYPEAHINKVTLPPLRILEPTIQPNFSAIPVFGSGDLNAREHQLKGKYGYATIPGQTDFYACPPYTKESPPSAANLPPSSSPYRGFYNQEFPGLNKAIENNDLSLLLKSNVEKEAVNIVRDAGSPDTVISSSSPESVLLEPRSKFPMLMFIDHLLPDLLPEKKRNGSPVIPLMYPIPLRMKPKPWNDSYIEEMDEEKDKENIPDERQEVGLVKTKMSGIGGYSAPLKDSGNVQVTVTLSQAAAEDICGVLARLADFLKIPIPASYEIVERTATPPSQKLGLYRRSKNSSDVSIHSLLNGKPRFCRHCDIVVLSAGIRKKTADLSCMSKEEQDEDEVIFCSTNCYMQFALTHRSTAPSEEKGTVAVVDHVGENVNEKITNAEDSLGSLIADEKLQNTGDALKAESLDMLKIEPMDVEDGSNDLRIDLSRTSDKNNSALNPDFSMDSLEKMDTCLEMDSEFRKWRSIKYKFWFPDNDATIKSKKKEEGSEKTGRAFYHTIKPSQMPKDERKCIFCHATGDGDTNGAARLLNVDVNKWVHLNCALWSAEVYETVNGALMNVETAFKRSRHLDCCYCKKQGASVRCFKTRCPNVYHFPCARKEQCCFFKDKTVLCPQHSHKGNEENKLDSVAVFRRVYINREEHKQVASMIQDEKFVLRVGSLIFLNIGQLLPTQIQAFHNTNCIYPVGYKVIRMYWSMRKLGRRSQYTCTINDLGGKPEFSVMVKDADQKDLVLKDKTSKAVWQKVIYPIEKMRKQAKTIKIFPDFASGDDLFGLTEPAVLRILESLPGVDTLNDYNFRYGRSPFLELPLAINPTGCARSEPKLRTHFKRPHTLHASCNAVRSFHAAFASPYHQMEISSSPYVKQFVHSKSSQYRKMKTEWRNNVYLARSKIQGLGLYAARDMEKHTMVIEYIGQLIRNEISERNEAIYEAQNRGTYMFRLDENRVIDATLSGGLARYINHSCYPNCVAENVQIDRENKILIITNRRVSRGEELSYDYMFAVEDDQHKIPCLCGAPNCRKWMN
ncbi:hypothetical protein JTE90_014303 [Oedothorax gibbosus]|uniref:Histone-lysine N-methyltransferase 2C n=1 Tax=Oedothorax gibbosus TaxID=931172 RepID=A0AAV6UW33_9ARAC|nr:hypothetical protein JTE90_014303 [Oedothorax gibbosus]